MQRDKRRCLDNVFRFHYEKECGVSKKALSIQGNRVGVEITKLDAQNERVYGPQTDASDENKLREKDKPKLQRIERKHRWSNII